MHDVRKVQITQKETLMISLPKRWYPQFPVQAGDDVTLHLQSDGSVILRRHDPSPPARLDPLPLAGVAPDEAWRRVQERYVDGADGLALVGLAGWPSSERARLQDRIGALFGTALADETEEGLDVRFLAGARTAPLHQTLRRLGALAVAALAGTPAAPAEVERIHLLVLRLANRLLEGRDLATSSALARTRASGALRTAEALRILEQAARALPPSPTGSARLAEALEGSSDGLNDSASRLSRRPGELVSCIDILLGPTVALVAQQAAAERIEPQS